MDIKVRRNTSNGRLSLSKQSVVSPRPKRYISNLEQKNLLPANIGNPQLCACGEKQDNNQILPSDITNPGEKIELEWLINGSLIEMKTNIFNGEKKY